MDSESKKILLGLLGERIVAKLLRDAGHTVEESLDIFDSEKDLLVNNKNVEVKSQVPLLIKDSFTVGLNQMTKIKESHAVYWISIPPKVALDDLSGCVFQMNPRKCKHRIWSTNSGKEMMLFPRRQEAMKIVHRIKDQKILQQLRQLSTSYL